NNLNSVRFKNAEKQFIDLLRYIKGVRPNLKIGIYGIPFRTYYPSQLKWNGDRKFDRLMSMSDIVFPSLYIIYPDKEKGKDANEQYLKDNLDVAFSYGERFNKPVIPFIWYIVHPNNKKY